MTPASARESVKIDLRGLFAGWGTYSQGETAQGQFGFRVLPEFTLDIRLGGQKLSIPMTSSSIIDINIPTDPPLFRAKSSRKTDSPWPPATQIGLLNEQNSQGNKSGNNFNLLFPLNLLNSTRAANTKSSSNNHASEKTGGLILPENRNSSSNSLEIEITHTDLGNSSGECPETPEEKSLPNPLLSTPAVSSSEPPHLTAELSLNLWGTLTIQTSQENQFRGKIKPYRLSLKYATSRLEARLGLQKISFGSATLLRPLMWFDRIDPRDPIQLTDGVYGLLFRTYISTGTNLWAWVLYGNKNPKGWEILSTQSRRPEFGVRAQVPAGRGELAFTFHQRRCHFESSDPAAAMIPVNPGSPSSFNFQETRMAADGKWDLGIGLWFEATLTKQRSPHLAFPWQLSLTVGMDYTFTLGNGLHLLAEYYQSDMSKAALSGDTFLLFRTRFLAASVSYPLTLLDRLSAIAFYDTRNNDVYSFICWQRRYDRWSLNLMAFWNPKEFRVYLSPDATNLFAGKGLQLMLLYNF